MAGVQQRAGGDPHQPGVDRDGVGSGGRLDVGLERLGQAQRDARAGVGVLGCGRGWLRRGFGGADLDPQVVAVDADGDGRRAGGVEQGGGDVVGRGRHGRQDRQAHRRFGRSGERVGGLAGAVVAQCGGGVEVCLHLRHVGLELHDATMTSN